MSATYLSQPHVTFLRQCQFETLEQRRVLSGVTITGAAWQNPVEPLDVNADAVVTIVDLQTVLGQCNECAELPVPPAQPPPFYDVNGDDQLTPQDAMLVSNALANGPVAVDDMVDITGSYVVIDVLANDTDANGDLVPASLTIVDEPDEGQLSMNADQTITFTPSSEFSGVDRFAYSVMDENHVLSNVAIATVRSWQNPKDCLDVNASGTVTPADVYTVLNRLNDEPVLPRGMEVPPPFYDVNGDHELTPKDALALVNCLNDPVICLPCEAQVSESSERLGFAEVPLPSPSLASVSEYSPVTTRKSSVGTPQETEFASRIGHPSDSTQMDVHDLALMETLEELPLEDVDALFADAVADELFKQLQLS